MSEAQAKPRGAATAYAWGVNAIRFIGERGLTSEFNDWCGGWKCPVTPEQVAAAAEMEDALAALFAAAEMTTFSDQFPAECEAARTALAKARGETA